MGKFLGLGGRLFSGGTGLGLLSEFLVSALEGPDQLLNLPPKGVRFRCGGRSEWQRGARGIVRVNFNYR